MVQFENITSEEAGEEINVLVRSLGTNEHFWLKFEKFEQKFTDLLFRVKGYD